MVTLGIILVLLYMTAYRAIAETFGLMFGLSDISDCYCKHWTYDNG